MVDGAPATSRVRTVVDCLRLLPERAAVDLLDRALQQGWITLAELRRAATGYIGRAGAPRLARLARLAGSGARSAAERVAVRLLRDAGITGWTANAPVHDDDGLIGLVDVAFESVKLALEFDGWAYHVTPDRFISDRRRQNRLVAAGWTVLRFTWRDLAERPEYVIGTITAMLARLGRRPR
jgi:very-short-patch-repair endonuclease